MFGAVDGHGALADPSTGMGVGVGMGTSRSCGARLYSASEKMSLRIGLSFRCLRSGFHEAYGAYSRAPWRQS